MRARLATTSLTLTLLPLLALAGPAHAHPEFEKAIEERSGRTIDCSFCHTHPDGPEGVHSGQIGALSAAQMQALNRARTAFEPGAEVDSPILNDFGDHLVTVLGKKRLVALRQAPLQMAAELGEGDLDGDGISDAQELLDGTHPLMRHHGDPGALFVVNLQRSWFEILMLMIATFFGVYGITHLLRWFGHEARSAFGDEARSAFGDEARSAFGDDARSAFGDDARSAFGDDARSVFGDDARSVFGDDARSVFGDDARSALGAKDPKDG